MKSYVVFNNKEESKYPCLMRSKQDGTVVLFEKRGVGTVVHSGDRSCPLGYHSNYWEGEDTFTRLDDLKVTLSND